MELSDANVSKDESFYGVFVENEANDSGTPKVFTQFKETLSAVKSNKTARFKLFHSATEAEHFSIFGQESPVKQIEKNTLSLSSSSTGTSNNFKSLKKEEIVAFRRLIEGGEVDKVVNAVNSNPRFLVSGGDTPSIIQEGCRYNAIHVAARYNQPEIVHFIMECILSPVFIRSLYGLEHSYLSRSEIISDLYLNTPDKATNDTPLHIASKFGHVNVVKELVSYEKCLLTPLNKYGESPKDVICSRKNKECYRDILNLLENGYFVPMLKSDDDCVQPTIGKPFLPKASKILSTLQNENPKTFSPTFDVRAVAGPMNESQALKFWKEWKSPVRKSFLSPSPRKCSLNKKPNEFKDKSIEKAGRDLAEKNKVGWAEYWPCLNKMVNIKSDKGLDLLEKYLKQRFSSQERDTPKKLISNEPSTLLSPMGELCKALECMRIESKPKEKSPRRSTPVSYTSLVKSCKILGDRLSAVIMSEHKNTLNIESLANRLCHEIRHLLVLEDSFYSDSRFDSDIQGKIHERVAMHICQLNCEHVAVVSSVITKLQKYYGCHAIGNRSEITAACLVSLASTIFNEKYPPINCSQSDDNEENCKLWFSAARPCLCDVKTGPRLKPKQLFLDDESTKTPDETRESVSNSVCDNAEDSLISTDKSVNPSSNGYDSDEDVYSSAPTSPCSENSSSDNELNEFFNAEPDFSYLLFSRNKPNDDDLDIFDAICDINMDPNQYPWVFRWLYSMNDYFNVNNISNLL